MRDWGIYRKRFLLLDGVLRSTGCDGIALIRGMVHWNTDTDRVSLLLYTAYVGSGLQIAYIRKYIAD